MKEKIKYIVTRMCTFAVALTLCCMYFLINNMTVSASHVLSNQGDYSYYFNNYYNATFTNPSSSSIVRDDYSFEFSSENEIVGVLEKNDPFWYLHLQLYTSVDNTFDTAVVQGVAYTQIKQYYGYDAKTITGTRNVSMFNAVGSESDDEGVRSLTYQTNIKIFDSVDSAQLYLETGDTSGQINKDLTITEASAANIQVTANIPSTFTVTVPKELSLDETGVVTAECISVSADIAGGKQITLAVPSTIVLSQEGKSDISGTVSISKTSFASNELVGGVVLPATLTIDASDNVSAGEWVGSFDIAVAVNNTP